MYNSDTNRLWPGYSGISRCKPSTSQDHFRYSRRHDNERGDLEDLRKPRFTG